MDCDRISLRLDDDKKRRGDGFAPPKAPKFTPVEYIINI